MARAKQKIIFVVVDGLGDRPFGPKKETPLGLALKPNLDSLASEGLCGLVKPTYYQGHFPTSKDAHLSLFGYDLRRWQMGRGVFEAFGADVKLQSGQVAWRGNFATVDDSNMKIIDRRAGRIHDTAPLVKAVNGLVIRGIKFTVKQGVDQRVAIVMSGSNLSERVSDGDYHKAGITAPLVKPLNQTKAAKLTAQAANDFLQQSHILLQNHIMNRQRQAQGLLLANYILMREPGQLKPLPSFQQLWGWKAACIAGGDMYQGIGHVLKMRSIKVSGATGDAHTDVAAKFRAAVRAIKQADFVYCHIKATDNFSHDKDCQGKEKMIEKIDQHIPILRQAKSIIVLTADHCTPCRVGEHVPDAVPLLVWGLGSGRVSNFSEKTCAKGDLGVIRGIDLLKKIIKISNTKKV